MTDGNLAGRIAITGGSGKAGSIVLRDLADRGYEVLNIDLRRCDHPSVRTLVTDITSNGQVFEALSGYTGLNDMAEDTRPGKIDAVVHFAGIPRNMLVPDSEVFRINTIGTYNVLDAAHRLGIPKVILASSETIYGYIFSPEFRKPHYFPLDEDYPAQPIDAYALSKLVNENAGRAFAMRGGMDVYALRISHVLTPDDYDSVVPAWLADSAIRKRSGWNFIDARDLSQSIHLCLAKSGLGFEIFNIANDDVIADRPVRELLERFYQGVSLREPVAPFGALLSNRKAKAVLGFSPRFNFRRSLGGEDQ